ncbi:NAD(P)/FAD-dependent oxidoreductase [Comamonas endophytica]|uniref:FAD-dependent oxidoreductase n=1 Tax=Comamonas endophytica TaxID=2949090 RepID=A0ABY6GFG5_9BURK|nr:MULTISPECIES: FAD-dependent oxidoreductase [unclassified Acidovorax]MCD2512573.1 FAD-dependent oxidoreductase [Acidovorax sp. D4N7]UYG53065.1 FAD-dependent oxidoreductase [Acidovorax sp. 5MLIR]
MTAGLLIIGASYAGMQLADAARAKGYTGPITLIGDEAAAPYQRPPLSKGLLLGKQTPEGLTIRAPAYFAEQRIQLRLQVRAEAIDRVARRVTLHGGEQLPYEWLVLATGARSRPLPVPGGDLPGAYGLRSLDDALAIDAMARTARRVCVIGGGFIGLETASALRTRGLEVDVVEAGAQLLGRVVPPEVSDYFARLHTEQGVRLHCSAVVEALQPGADGRVAAVLLADGRRLDCDAVVVGIGVLANDELAQAAGLPCAQGVLVDACGRTPDPWILAAGDCARFPNPFGADPAQPLRLESIQAANDLARAAASVIAGRPEPYQAVPWFWSDQYASKLQIAGLGLPGDLRVLRGELEQGRFSLFLLRAGRVVCVHSVNRPAEHLLARKLIESRVQADAAALADPDFALKSLLEPGPAAALPA